LEFAWDFYPIISDQIVVYKHQKRDIKTAAWGFNRKLCVIFFILNGLLWGFAGMEAGDTISALLVSLLFTVAILIAVVDLRIRLIPNELILIMLCLGVPFQIIFFGWSSLLPAFLCMIAIGLVFTLVGRLVGFEQVGAGDVKLVAVMGFVLGYPNIMIALTGLTVVLLIYCLGGLALKKLTRYSTFPFAPFLMFGTISALTNFIFFY